MVAYAFGLKSDVSVLRQRFAISARGTDMGALTRMAKSLGLAARPVKLELENLHHLKTPAILHWKFRHFVVLKRVTRKGAVIHDPAVGQRFVRLAELSESFTGAALELWPTDQFRPRDDRHLHSFRDLIAVPRGFVAFLANLMAIGFCLELLGVILPVLSQWSIDHVAASANLHLLGLLAVGMAGSTLLQAILELARAWTITRATIDFSLRWRAAVFDHLLRLPLDWFQKRRIGDISSRFGSAETIVGMLNDTVVGSIIDGVMSIVVLVIMFVYDLRLTALTLAGTLIYVGIRLLRAGVIRRLTRERVQASAMESSQFIETVRGIRAVKLFTREEGRQQEWMAAAVDEANSIAALSKSRILFRGLSAVIGGTEQVVVFVVAMQMVIAHQFTIGALVAFNAYRSQFYMRIASLVDNWMDLKMAEVHAQRLSDIVMTEPEPGSDIGQLVRIGELGGSIRCVGVRFRYGEFEPYVLDGVDLEIFEGESVAIVGASGCGKSTLLSLLVGLAQPNEGEILYGGIALRALSTATARRHIGCVMQDDTLFAGTVAQNIAAFDSEIDIDFAIECAIQAQLHGDIIRMPMGYSTLVGDLGGTLSGGQRQRLCVARALYRKPKILVLDEATSHLDVPTEQAVTAAIKMLGITRILVAHRPETIRSADRIIALSDGRIMQEPPAVPTSVPST
jgi:ATP-binding cassette subfamily B protein RaxB